MTKIISIFNNKGGVGKTTLLWNIAHALGCAGKKVLMIDFDPQCNLSIAVLGQTMFTSILPNQNVPYGSTLRAYLQRFLQGTGGMQFFSFKGPHTNRNVDLVAGDFWLNVYSESLNVGSDLLAGTGIAKYAVISEFVDFANSKSTTPYDFVLVDLPPSFGAIVRAGLYSSDYYIIPCTSDTFSAYCVGLIAEMLPIFSNDWNAGYARFSGYNPGHNRYSSLGSPKFAGWVFNGFDMRGGSFVRADAMHADNIQDSINNKLINNPAILSAIQNSAESRIGTIEDMNVLAQNSIWQSAPIEALSGMRPVKTLQDKGTWAPNQLANINSLKTEFSNIANRIISICV